MYLASVNVPRQLLHLTFVGRVSAHEIAAGRENVIQLLDGLKPGFKLLSDLSQLDSFEPDSAVEIGKNMTLFSEHKLGLVVRVIPDSSKDFGLNILSFFHYAHHTRTLTFKTMAEAAKALSL